MALQDSEKDLQTQKPSGEVKWKTSAAVKPSDHQFMTSIYKCLNMMSKSLSFMLRTKIRI